VRHRLCLRRGARSTWPLGNALHTSAVGSNVLACWIANHAWRSVLRSPPPLPAPWCTKHVATGERPAPFSRWQQRPGLCLKNPFVEERLLCAPPPLPAPWCTKHVATRERSAHFCRWQQRPGLLDCESCVEERPPFATAFACAVVHEDRGHGRTLCTLLPLAATSWLVFRYSARDGASPPCATAFACAVVHEAPRDHGGTFCTLLPLAAASWLVFRESVRGGASSLYATAFACAVVHEARGHGGTLCTLLPLAATSWLVFRTSTLNSNLPPTEQPDQLPACSGHVRLGVCTPCRRVHS
jgi:hypothetical protein